MTFGEKLLKLRKEKNYSQEELAEKCNTTRQAVSKWENDQGYPETEKLLMLSTIFKVTVDYLLNDKDDIKQSNETGYYVSQEMAEGYLVNEKKTARKVALGLSLLALSFIPYQLFQNNPTMWVFATIGIVVVAIGIIISAGFGEDEQYAVLKQTVLILDTHFLAKLSQRKKGLEKKSVPLVIAGLLCFVIGILPLLLTRKNFIPVSFIEPLIVICILFIATGIGLVISTLSILEAYDLLVNNEKHSQTLSKKIVRKVRKKLDNLD